VVFREDRSRIREGHAGAILASIRRVAVTLLRRTPGKGSGVTKRLKAGWDDDYLLQVLQGNPASLVRWPCGMPWPVAAISGSRAASASTDRRAERQSIV
jgi:hypothetical protein